MFFKNYSQNCLKKIKNLNSAAVTLLTIVSWRHRRKKIYSKLETVKVIRLQMCPNFSSFLFLNKKNSRKNKKQMQKKKINSLLEFDNWSDSVFIKMQEYSLKLCLYMCEKNIKDMKLKIKYTRIFPSNTGLLDMCDNYLFIYMARKLFVTRTPNYCGGRWRTSSRIAGDI